MVLISEVMVVSSSGSIGGGGSAAAAAAALVVLMLFFLLVAVISCISRTTVKEDGKHKEILEETEPRVLDFNIFDGWIGEHSVAVSAEDRPWTDPTRPPVAAATVRIERGHATQSESSSTALSVWLSPPSVCRSVGSVAHGGGSRGR